MTTEDVFKRNGWKFESSTKPISGYVELGNCQTRLMPDCSAVDRMPEAFFGKNYLHITGPNGFSLSICPDGIVRGTALLRPHTADMFPLSKYGVEIRDVKVADAIQEETLKTQYKDIIVDNISPNYDWTFTSPYWGHCEGYHREALMTVDSKDDVFPMDLLTQRLPPLWFKVVHLIEDDLSDSGHSEAAVRIRVMDDFFYILYKQHVVVHGVIDRSIEMRFFHKFDSQRCIREFRWLETDFKVNHSQYKENELNSNSLTAVERIRLLDDIVHI